MTLITLGTSYVPTRYRRMIPILVQTTEANQHGSKKTENSEERAERFRRSGVNPNLSELRSTFACQRILNSGDGHTATVDCAPTEFSDLDTLGDSNQWVESQRFHSETWEQKGHFWCRAVHKL